MVLVLALVAFGLSIGALGRRIEVENFEKLTTDSDSPTPEKH